MESLKGIYYKTYGKNLGYSIVFLHGYLESSESWDNFAPLFEDEYFVVCIDLPGHGKSRISTEDGSMEKMAEAVISVTNHLGIFGFHLIGHSMGGYLALAIAEYHSDKLNSTVLLHSHCFADPDEKKANRNREIELIRSGKKELIVNTSIPNLYASTNLNLLADEIKNSLRIAMQTDENGIIYALNAMKSRPDRSHVLARSDVPFLLVGGTMDNHIPYARMEEMKSLNDKIELLKLEKSGHMGFVEEKEKLAIGLRNFFNKNFECK